MQSWVDSANGHPHFPIQNLPFGIVSVDGGGRRWGVAIGEQVLDLAGCAADGCIDLDPRVATATDLNAWLAWSPEQRSRLRQSITAALDADGDAAARPRVARHLWNAADCVSHLPARIGDYSDFYAGIHHARAVGALFRPDHPLLPNYKHVPIGYHGRASSIRVSGADIVRPLGQIRPDPDAAPVFAPTSRLDYEVEMGVWIGPGNAIGQPIPIAAAADHIAGLSLLNDWSARDIQAWEYQPLGPFLAKSFITTISPWIVTADALAPFRIPQPPRNPADPAPLPYLWDTGDQQRGTFAIQLDCALSTPAMRAAGRPPARLSRARMTDLYWTAAQLVAHHTSNGCPLNPGDLLGSGTISGSNADSAGSLMEITAGGRRPIELPGGECRTFLQDGDEVIMTAFAEADGQVTIGFGECRGIIAPALSG